MKNRKTNWLMTLAVTATLGFSAMNVNAYDKITYSQSTHLSDTQCGDNTIYTNYYYLLAANVYDAYPNGTCNQTNSLLCKAGIKVNHTNSNVNYRNHQVNNGLYFSNVMLGPIANTTQYPQGFDSEGVLTARGVIPVTSSTINSFYSNAKQASNASAGYYMINRNSAIFTNHNYTSITPGSGTSGVKTSPFDIRTISNNNDLINASIKLPDNDISIGHTMLSSAEVRESSIQLEIDRNYNNASLYGSSFSVVKSASDANIDARTLGRYLQPAIYYVEYCVEPDEPTPAKEKVLIYKSNDGNNEYGRTTITTTDLTLGTGLSALPTRSGYTLKGWNRDKNQTNENYAPRGTITNVADTLTIKSSDSTTDYYEVYAVWEEDPTPEREKVLIYKTTDGNTPYGSTTITTTNITLGTGLDNLPTRNGYKLKGWAISTARAGNGQKDYEPTGTINNVTSTLSVVRSDSTTDYYEVYAVWEELPASQVSITYMPNADDVTGMPTPNPYVVNVGTCIRLANNVTPIRSGYTFLGWNTKADGTGTMYETGKENFCINENITLYAIWQREDTYYVHYRGNEPTGTANNIPVNIDNRLISINTIIEGNNPKPTLNGYEFLGWSTDANATSPDSNYAPGTEYKEGKNLVLYAVWKKISTPTPSNPESPKTGVEDILLPAGGAASLAGIALVVLKKKKGYLQFK